MVIINEDSRQELVAKSRRSEKGLQRYKKRLKSRILSSVKEFNQREMNRQDYLKSLGWKLPYEVATEMFGKEPFEKLGIYEIDSKDAILNNNLFKDNK